MSECVKNHLALLQVIANSNPRYIRAILKVADKSLVRSICECIFNVAKGNIKLDEKSKSNLYKYRHALRKLCRKSNLKSKKKILNQSGTGFLPLLLPIVLGAISSLLNK